MIKKIDKIKIQSNIIQEYCTCTSTIYETIYKDITLLKR